MILYRLSAWIPILLLAGCTGGNLETRDPNTPSEEQKAAANEWTINTVSDAAITSALIRQHTLFPYHFNPGLETLNELGERDLASLAAHYRARPGELGVRRGDAPEDLYTARLAVVSKHLQDAGVDTARLKIIDAPPGGPGLGSDRVVKILLQSETKGLSGDSNASGSSSNMSSSNSGTNTGTSEVQK